MKAQITYLELIKQPGAARHARYNGWYRYHRQRDLVAEAADYIDRVYANALRPGARRWVAAQFAAGWRRAQQKAVHG